LCFESYCSLGQLPTPFSWPSAEISVDDDDWNDGLLATIREKVFNVIQLPNFLIFISPVNYEFC
jgi:hypothetical protein